MCVIHLSIMQWENVCIGCQLQSKSCVHFDTIRSTRALLASLLHTSRSTEYRVEQIIFPLSLFCFFLLYMFPGSMFFAPTTALGSGLYAISLYGGLVLFSGFLLYDTQLIMKKAEVYPQYGAAPFDPINS